MIAGEMLGSFRILEKIGEGGMGEVYRARDHKLNRNVALKIVGARLGEDEALRRFLREAQALAALNHPHIAQIYGLEDSGDNRALVMELVEGEDLAERMARERLPLDEALAIARQIADASGSIVQDRSRGRLVQRMPICTALRCLRMSVVWHLPRIRGRTWTSSCAT